MSPYEGKLELDIFFSQTGVSWVILTFSVTVTAKSIRNGVLPKFCSVMNYTVLFRFPYTSDVCKLLDVGEKCKFWKYTYFLFLEFCYILSQIQMFNLVMLCMVSTDCLYFWYCA